MNYIKHLERIHELFYEDERITPYHISLYLALFHQWNAAKFPERLSISRSEVMHAAKHGSVNTYTKCLKELHQFNYLEYLPSNNPFIGSIVNLYRFDNSSDNSCDNSSCLKSDNSSCLKSDNTRDNASEMEVIPYINNININKQYKHIERAKKVLPSKKSSKSLKEKSSERANNHSPKKEKSEYFSRPNLDEVKTYFSEKSASEMEAEKFYNYFESNGWLIGGRTKMKNWQAAARNWMINSKKFNPPSPGQNLSSEQNKSYNIPL
jgi:hypothetical protein